MNRWWRHSRYRRQAQVANWCRRAFGSKHADSVQQHAIRLLEEALEAYQSAGAARWMAHRLVDYVFDRPAGSLRQELGGVGVTLLALAAAAGLDADLEEATEVQRVLSIPIEHFTARNAAKNAAGFSAEPPTYCPVVYTYNSSSAEMRSEGIVAQTTGPCRHVMPCPLHPPNNTDAE